MNTFTTNIEALTWVYMLDGYFRMDVAFGFEEGEGPWDLAYEVSEVDGAGASGVWEAVAIHRSAVSSAPSLDDIIIRYFNMGVRCPINVERTVITRTEGAEAMYEALQIAFEHAEKQQTEVVL